MVNLFHGPTSVLHLIKLLHSVDDLANLRRVHFRKAKIRDPPLDLPIAILKSSSFDFGWSCHTDIGEFPLVSDISYALCFLTGVTVQTIPPTKVTFAWPYD